MMRGILPPGPSRIRTCTTGSGRWSTPAARCSPRWSGSCRCPGSGSRTWDRDRALPDAPRPADGTDVRHRVRPGAAGRGPAAGQRRPPAEHPDGRGGADGPPCGRGGGHRAPRPDRGRGRVAAGHHRGAARHPARRPAGGHGLLRPRRRGPAARAGGRGRGAPRHPAADRVVAAPRIQDQGRPRPPRPARRESAHAILPRSTATGRGPS